LPNQDPPSIDAALSAYLRTLAVANKSEATIRTIRIDLR
jgi:hypothetical protein